MQEENRNQEFRLKIIDEIRNYLIEEINQNELISKKHNKFCRVVNYINHILIVISTINWWVSIYAFVGILITFMSSAIGLEICVITVGIKKYKSIIKKKKKKRDKIVSLTKSKLNRIEMLSSKPLIDSILFMMNLFQ